MLHNPRVALTPETRQWIANSAFQLSIGFSPYDYGDVVPHAPLGADSLGFASDRLTNGLRSSESVLRDHSQTRVVLTENC